MASEGIKTECSDTQEVKWVRVTWETIERVWETHSHDELYIIVGVVTKEEELEYFSDHY